MRKLALLCAVVLTMLMGCALTPMKLNIESPRNFNPIRLAAEVLTENDWLVDDMDTRIIRTNYKYKDRMDHRLRVRAHVICVGNRNFKIRFDKEMKNNDGYKRNVSIYTSTRVYSFGTPSTPDSASGITPMKLPLLATDNRSTN